MIVVLDFGSQYTQLIARRIRESKVYCEIHPFNVALEKITALNPKGIILSGGPASVYQDNAPKVIRRAVGDCRCRFSASVTAWVLSTSHFGGAAARADRREYGPAQLVIDNDSDLFHGFSKRETDSGVDEPWRQDDELSQGLGHPGP